MKSVMRPRVALRCRWEGYSKVSPLARTIKSMTEETSKAAFDRGVTAGEIAARLTNHDVHFASINGHIGELVEGVHGMRMDIQRLADQAQASAKTLLATAEALKAANEARTEQSTRSWSPWVRVFAVIAAVATVVSIVTAITVLRRS